MPGYELAKSFTNMTICNKESPFLLNRTAAFNDTPSPGITVTGGFSLPGNTLMNFNADVYVEISLNADVDYRWNSG